MGSITLFLPNKPRGISRVDDRRVLNGIFWVLRSGAPWRDVPASYGPAPLAIIALGRCRIRTSALTADFCPA